MLNATLDAIATLWRPWINTSLTFPSTRYTLVNVPTENLRPSWEAQQRALNAALQQSFAAGAFPPNWQLVDWASMMHRARPPTVVPSGDQKASWHYACRTCAPCTACTIWASTARVACTSHLCCVLRVACTSHLCCVLTASDVSLSQSDAHAREGGIP
jgi:hypothetical protein